ncbi:hypothetical protein Ccrd_022293 [Cynara cardunculus var. scolymus]|uniref:Uncharacterized protein n=1 Tax=Cynara cardunculus var. scolymus TaxID=59895 RepID=A0A103XYY6_CYNCS|nr:hypothetical protein Ccrd_022293 [Cynara cardunculus var. scolymus]
MGGSAISYGHMHPRGRGHWQELIESIVLNTSLILRFMLQLPRNMSGAGHPDWTKWDDSFSFRICTLPEPKS